MRKQIAAIGYALAAAFFYALNVPCSKVLLGESGATMMAAFLYLGAGIGVAILYLPQRKHELREERLNRQDLPYVIGMVVLDVLAPILLMFGINQSSSASASLLGNFEIVATGLIALLLFHETISKWLWTAIGFITVSSMLLSFDGVDTWRFSIGSLLVLAATICWGLENNCTRSISEKSTFQIVTIKGLCSGMGSLIIAFAIGETLPRVQAMLWILLLGFVAYGLSIFTYIRAQQTLGAAKTSAYYAVAPFIGMFLSFLFFHEALSWRYVVGLVTMLVGTGLVIMDTLQATAH